MSGTSASGRKPTTREAVERFLLSHEGIPFTARQLAKGVYGSDTEADVRAAQAALHRINVNPNRIGTTRHQMVYMFTKDR